MPLDHAALAARVLTALSDGRQITPLSQDPGGLTLADAYAIGGLVRDGLGWTRMGCKVGFTNRALWEQYGVDQPFWGTVGAESLRPAGTPVTLTPALEPRIEAEIVLGLSRAPEPGMDEAALAACVDWVAPGFEIVQSVYPGWAIAPEDGVAAQGMHGGLMVGDRLPATPEILAGLADVPVTLSRNGETVDTGTGANALDGPLSVLAHLVDLLDADNALRAGELVSTGSLCDAPRIEPGEVWSARFDGVIDATVTAEFT